MFTTLAQDTDQNDPALSALILEELSSESLSLALEISQERHALETLFTTIHELETLRASISTSGMTPSLLTFANANNQLSHAISEIPALESLADSYTDVERDAALEGIGSKIKELAQAAITKIKSVVGKIISTIKLRNQSLNELRAQISHYTETVQGKQYHADAGPAKVKLIKHEQLIELLEIAARANDIGLELLKLDLPESHEAKSVWEEHVEKIIAERIGHYSVVHDGKIYAPKPLKTSLPGMGYGESSFHEIISKLEVYLNEALTTGSRFEVELEKKSNETYSRIDSLSIDVQDSNGHTVTHRSRAAGILEDAFLDLGYHYYSLDFDSWVHGVRQGLRTLGYLASAYK